MIYNPNAGKIYDTIFFFVEYFNKEETSNYFNKVREDVSLVYEYYNEIKAGVTEIPPLLFPFFYIRSESASALTAFFTYKTDFQCVTLDSFINRIKENTDILYKETVNSIFFNIFDSEDKKFIPLDAPEDYIDAINALDLPFYFKLQVSLLFGNFNYAVSVLTDYLKIVYSHVNELHDKYANNIDIEFQQIHTGYNIRLYKNALNYDKDRFQESTTISISLLNQFIIYDNKKYDFFLLGLKHEESILDRHNESKATSDNFIIICGSEIRMKIIHALIDINEMTVSQIAKYLDCPASTLTRHIDALLNNGIITITKREGLQIYYRLNVSFFKRIKINLDNLFEEIIKKVGGQKNG